MSEYKTEFGSMDRFRKGGIEVIADDPRNYVFSNVFEVAAGAHPFERVAVGKNFEYVIEAVRAEGASPWYRSAHDEFALAMDGEIEVRLVKPSAGAAAPEEGSEGAILLPDEPEGARMGRIVLRQGHMALLPAGAAYAFRAERPAVMLIQTIEGPLTVQKWADICLTGDTK